MRANRVMFEIGQHAAAKNREVREASKPVHDGTRS
jgi:hypothetical protein